MCVYGMHIFVSYFCLACIKKQKETLPKFSTQICITSYKNFTNDGVRDVQVGLSEEQEDFWWEKHYRYYIEQWELLDANVDENDKPHTNREYRHYQAWYQGVTRCRLRPQWTQDDYADIESSDDEDTAYDQSTREGR